MHNLKIHGIIFKMKKYCEVYNYDNPTLGKLNMLIVGQIGDSVAAKKTLLSKLVITKNIDTQEKLKEQIEQIKNKGLDKMSMPDFAEALFSNSDTPELVSLNNIAVNPLLKKSNNGSGNKLGLDAMQGVIQAIAKHGYTYLGGDARKNAIPFYQALGFELDQQELEFVTNDADNFFAPNHVRFKTSITNPKLVTDKFKLNPQFTDLATEIINNK